MELEPLYQQAFRLLHSRRDDSAEKLKKKLFEVMGRRYEAPKEAIKPEVVAAAPASALEPLHISDNNDSLDTKIGHVKHTRHGSDADAEARSCSSGAEEVVTDDAGNADKLVMMETGISDIDADQFAIEMGIECVACGLFEVSSNNQLVECQECHSLYHQLCHKPNVTEQEVNDPRSVWYCARCSKTMRKLEKNSVKPVKSQANSKESTASSKSDGSSGKQEPAFFRRLDSGKHQSVAKETSSSSSGASSAKPYSGLAGLAANLSGKASDKTSSSSSLRDDRGSKDGKRLAPAAETPPGAGTSDKWDKVKLASASHSGGTGSEAVHDKATKKTKTGVEKPTKPERREADGCGSSGGAPAAGGKSEGIARVGQQQQQSASKPTAVPHESVDDPARGGRDDRKSGKPNKSSADGPAKGGGQQQLPVDKVQRGGERDTPALAHKDESSHKHKLKRLRKE